MHDKIDRDAFDTLSEKEPEKFLKLQNSLVQFVNGHLDKLNLSGLWFTASLKNKLDKAVNFTFSG